MNKERTKMKSAHKILTLLVAITLISAPIYSTAVYAETESTPVTEPTTEPNSEPTSTPTLDSKSTEKPQTKPTEQPEEQTQKLCRERPIEPENTPQIKLQKIDALDAPEQVQDEPENTQELEDDDENLPYCDELEEEPKEEKPEEKNHCNCEQQGKGNVNLPIGIDNSYEYSFKDSTKANNSNRGAIPSGISYNSMPNMTYASYSSAPAVQPVTYNGSENNYLSTLSVSGHEFKQAFKKERLTYSLTVTNDVESLDITAYAEDGASTVTVSGNTSLKTGTNKILIIVTAENGNTKNYKIIVTKEK